MIISKLRQHNHILNIRFMIIVSVLATTAVGAFYAGTRGIGFREIIIAVGLIIGLVSVLLGERGIRIGFLGWILLFVLGYRTLRIPITYLATRGFLAVKRTEFIIHPLAVLIVFLLLLLLFNQAWSNRKKIPWGIPPMVWIFSFFWVWGLVIGSMRGYPIQEMFPDFFNFVTLLPVFVVTGYTLHNKQYWKYAVLVFYLAGFYIAAFGAVEYLFPGIIKLLPDFISTTETTSDLSGFARARFAFWGQPAAAFVSFLALPFALKLWEWYRHPLARLLLIGSLVVFLFGIFIAGWRSLWLGTAVMFVALAVLKRNIRSLVLVIAALVVIYSVMPIEARVRLDTLLSSLQGETVATDSSSIVRYNRAEDALQMAIEAPLGSGWGASGWVHSDIIQLAADIGILSVVVFVIWYLTSAFALMRRYLRSPDNLTLSLLGSFVGVGLLFITQPIYVLAQLVIPVWFVWALAHIRSKELDDPETVMTGNPIHNLSQQPQPEPIR